MKQSIIRTSPGNMRTFTACLLSITMLLAPLASFAASPNNRSASPSTLTSPSKNAQQQSTISADRKLANELFVNPPAVVVGTPSITASMTAPATANPGGTISYTANISNITGGADATGVTFTDAVDPNTTYVANSLKISPLAFPDSYTAGKNVTLNVAAPGVLTNDTGTPAPTAVPIAGGGTTQGGTVTLLGDGSFTYNPPNNFVGTDTFTYSAHNTQTPDDSTTVTLTVIAPPAAVDDSYPATFNTTLNVPANGVLGNDT